MTRVCLRSRKQFRQRKKEKGRGNGKKLRNKRKTCHSVAFLNAALTQFSTKRERHMCVYFQQRQFLFYFYTQFRFFSVSSGYLPDSRLNLAPCLWETRAAAAIIRYSFLNVGKQSLWRFQNMQTSIISIDHFYWLMKY